MDARPDMAMLREWWIARSVVHADGRRGRVLAVWAGRDGALGLTVESRGALIVSSADAWTALPYSAAETPERPSAGNHTRTAG